MLLHPVAEHAKYVLQLFSRHMGWEMFIQLQQSAVCDFRL